MKTSKQVKTKSDLDLLVDSIESIIDIRYKLLTEEMYGENGYYANDIDRSHYKPAKRKLRKAIKDYIRKNINN